MAVINRPRPQWSEWVALEANYQPITDMYLIPHAHLLVRASNTSMKSYTIPSYRVTKVNIKRCMVLLAIVRAKSYNSL
jgi:hypothetical protein